MGYMNNAQIEITNWLNSERNYADGVFLFDKYGRNPQLKRMFPGRSERYAGKLAYELGKLIGIGFDEKPDALKAIPTPVLPPTSVTTDTLKTGDEQVHRAELAEENSEEQADRAEEQAERAEIAAEKLEMIANTIGAIAAGESLENPAYPTVINRIIAESSRLYRERGMLKRQQNDLPDENTAENIFKRKLLIDQIDALSARLDVLYRAKSAYLEKGTMPDEAGLFPRVDTTIELDREKLLQLRNNLRSQITRAKNRLKFQSQRKEKKPNPMPACPKRTELENRIREKEKELCEVEERLKDVN